jgi:hypothetical protein
MFSNKELRDMGIHKGYDFLAYVIIFAVIVLVLVFAVAFFHDLFTGQLLTGGGGGCNPEFSDCGDEIYDGIGRR